MSLTEGMKKMDDAGDLLNQAMRLMVGSVDSGEIPPNLHHQLWKIREELRDLEALLGEHAASQEPVDA